MRLIITRRLNESKRVACFSITHKFRTEYEAKLDVGEAVHSASHDSVSWRLIFGASKVASEAGNFS